MPMRSSREKRSKTRASSGKAKTKVTRSRPRIEARATRKTGTGKASPTAGFPRTLSKVSRIKGVHSFEFREIRGVISQERLLDLLSEFLAVEQGGARLYQSAIEQSRDPGIRDQLEMFLKQTLRHAELLEETILSLGGNPARLSVRAQLQSQRIEQMQRLQIPLYLREAADLENLLFAETKDQHDWELLARIVPLVEDKRTQTLLQELVSDVLEEEEDHFQWTRQVLFQAMIFQLLDFGKKRQAA